MACLKMTLLPLYNSFPSVGKNVLWQMVDTLIKSTYMIKCSVFPSFEIKSVREPFEHIVSAPLNLRGSPEKNIIIIRFEGLLTSL